MTADGQGGIGSRKHQDRSGFGAQVVYLWLLASQWKPEAIKGALQHSAAADLAVDPR